MKELLEQRGIDTLYHFTQAKNLENIFKYGLLPRTKLGDKCINSHINDYNRFDNCLNAVCMSLEFLNYKMFYKLRMENNNAEWAVLKLNAQILCKFPCAYCWTNAGDSRMYSIPIKQRMGEAAFLDLFKDCPGYPRRSELDIPDYFPTNPQAEVLVFGEIPVLYIDKVYFEDKGTLDKFEIDIPDNIDIEVNRSVFLYRCDWEHWKMWR